MKGYTRLIAVNLKLALRERIAIFFNYVFPLIFFFGFGQALGVHRGGAIAQVVTMVLVIGILGNGLFGGGIRAVQDREQNILRRFKVAPISPLPLLMASIVTGWALYLPAVVLTIGLARVFYGMPLPHAWVSLLILVSIGVMAFRAVGLIIAAVANSAQESQILVQLVYLPMLFLTGATIPLALLPRWAQEVAQFLPGTHLVTGLNGVMLRGESALEHWQSLLVLIVTAVVATFISMQLFRWEKGEKIRTSAKLWLAAVVVPSLLLGGYQTATRQQIAKTRVLYRDMMRKQSVLVRDVRIYTGGAKPEVVESGWVLVQAGRIASIAEGFPPDSVVRNAEVIEGSGMTLLPGLIDVRVDLTATGAPNGDAPGRPEDFARRALAAYLYCGVTAVRTVRPLTAELNQMKTAIDAGEILGPEIFTCGAARDAGCEAADGPPSIPEMRPGQPYVPSLAAVDGIEHLYSRNPELLERQLVREAVPEELLARVRRTLQHGNPQPGRDWLRQSSQALTRAASAGAELVAGSGAGSPLAFHGPSLHRELALWTEAGIAPADALRAATWNAAMLLGASGRIGAVRAGYEANLIVVNGNPLEDPGALGRIVEVISKGERLDRQTLFQDQQAAQ